MVRVKVVVVVTVLVRLVVIVIVVVRVVVLVLVLVSVVMRVMLVMLVLSEVVVPVVVLARAVVNVVLLVESVNVVVMCPDGSVGAPYSLCRCFDERGNCSGDESSNTMACAPMSSSRGCVPRLLILAAALNPAK